MPPAPTAAAADHRLKALSLKADRLVMGVLLIGTLVAMTLGALNGPALSGSSIALGLFLVALLIWRIAPGTLLSRLSLASIGMMMVALQIQLSQGTTELHFGVFVFLAFLLVYRDWRPVLMAAATIAVHHILFDRLQAMGWPVYCTTEANFGLVLAHASFVVVQTAVEILMAVRMRADAIEAQELQRLCQPTAQGQLNLDVQGIAVSSASAQAVRAAFLKLDQLVGEARMTADVVLQSSADMAQSNQHLHSRSTQVAQKLQDTAGHIQHIRGDAQTSAEASGHASQIAQQATDSAQSCGQLVQQVVSAMDAIHDSSRKIGDIVGLIDSIAFQTNILALNAAVEAARAGEHGRGFAVVATEVRQLAQRSATAAKDVRTLIQGSLQHASQGSHLVGKVGASMHHVVEHTERMAQAINTLNLGATSQAQELAQAADTITQLDGMTQANTSLVEQTTQSTTQLLEQARTLQSVVAGVCSGAQPYRPVLPETAPPPPRDARTPQWQSPRSSPATLATR